MHINKDSPTLSPWAIDSTNNNAAFVTSQAFLNDGKVAKACRMSWDVGSQANTNFVTLTATITDYSFPNDIAVGALLMPKTSYAIPAGVFVDMIYTFGMTQVIFGGKVVALDNGATAIVSTNPGVLGITPDSFQIKIYNSKGTNSVFTGSTWATSGQLFDVGEIVFGSLQEFKITTEPQRALKGGPTERRSHNNTSQPLYGPNPYYEWTFNLTPMGNTSSYGSASSWSAVEYELTQARSVLVLPRIYTPGTTTMNDADLNQLAIFGRVTSVQPLKGYKDGPYWTAGVVVAQAPP